MNPNDGNQNTNLNSIPNGESSPFVNPVPVGNMVTQNTQTPATPQVAPTPMPSQGTVPSASPMPAPAPQTPPSATPMAATPLQSVNPVTPAAPAAPTATPTQVVPMENPNGVTPNIDMSNVPPQASAPDVAVIDTKKSKGSNILLIIIIIILIVFVFNIDTIAEYYQNYMETGSLTSTKVKIDNVSDGYILINSSDSSLTVNNIKYYNFEKKSDNKISFNYSSSIQYDDITKENIYIEIYNSEKELLYKELFNPNKVVDVSVSNYTMDVKSEVYSNAYYACVKALTSSELSKTSTLKCTYSDNAYNYENVYHFTNESLVSYDVSKQSKSIGDTKLDNEYNELKEKINVGYENNTIKYSIDLNKTYSNFSPLYEKGLTPLIVKNSETIKKWICE